MSDDINSNSDFETFKHLMDNGIIDCKVCKFYLTIPIRLVEGIGHVCNTCWNSEEVSNSTRKAIRDHALETMIKDVKMACRNRKYGCNVMDKYEDLIEHQTTTCSYTPKKCPLAGWCKWEGKVEEFLQHFLNSHEQYALETVANDTYLANNWDIREYAYSWGVLLSEEYAIRFCLDYHSIANKLVITLSNIRDDKTYDFKIRFVGEEGTLTVDNCKVEPLQSMLGKTHALSKVIKLAAFRDIMKSATINVIVKMKK